MTFTPPIPRLKICCIASVAEARTAVAGGADALGLVSAMPSGPGVIDEAAIAEVAAAAPPAVATFLLTARTDAEGVAEQLRRCGAGVVQLVDRMDDGAHARLRALVPGVKLVQVVHVRGAASVAEAAALAPLVDAILLDSGNPSLLVKELGGTGRTHDWAVSREIREQVEVPVFLAGGLRADNVREAVRTVRPFGVDVCSGVRTERRLDAEKLGAFARALRD